MSILRTFINKAGVVYDALKTKKIFAEDMNLIGETLDDHDERIYDIENNPPGGASDFTDLGDVPASYGSQANKLVSVKGDETGLEFIAPTIPVKATGAEVDAGTDDAKFVTPKAMEDSAYAKTAAIPVKATGAEVDAGTDDAKFVTPKAMEDSDYIKEADLPAIITMDDVNTAIETAVPPGLELATYWEVEESTLSDLKSLITSFPANYVGWGPIGEIKIWPFVTAPTKFVLCNGTEYANNSAQAPLFGVMSAAEYLIYKGTAKAPTVVAATDIFTLATHGITNYCPVIFYAEGGTLPTNIVEGTRYYVHVINANTFYIADTPFGANKDIGSAGAGAWKMYSSFKVPNLCGKVPVGYSSGETEFDDLNESGGEKTHTLLEAEMPAHTHTEGYRSNNTAGTAGVQGGSAANNAFGFATGSKGGGGAHNNLQPYLSINFIIRYDKET